MQKEYNGNYVTIAKVNTNSHKRWSEFALSSIATVADRTAFHFSEKVKKNEKRELQITLPLW
jgi:hypothetical protein